MADIQDEVNQREKQMLYINTYIWSLERRYQGSIETQMERTCIQLEKGEGRMREEVHGNACITWCEQTPVGIQFFVWCRASNSALGQTGRLGSREAREGHVLPMTGYLG